MQNRHPPRPWRPVTSLAFLLLAGALGLPSRVTAASITKDVMLQDMVRNVIQPDYQELAAKSMALTAAIQQLTQGPTVDSLAKARAAWLATVLAARQIQWLQIGPIADREYLATFYFSKVLPHRIEDVLNSSGPLDSADLDELGAATKGLFALEYLLFESRPESPAKAARPPAENHKNLFGTNVQRRCRFLLALAIDVQKKADQVAVDWAGTNRADVGPRFVAGGQETLNRLVNQLAQNLETIAESRLNLVLQLPAPVIRHLHRIEGARSRTSLPQLVANLRGAYEIYRGREGLGMDDYLRALNPTLETRVDRQFQKAIAALQAVDAPLEEAADDRKAFVQRAYEAIRDLEILFKVDLASALGVTIMFNSNDGD